LFGRAANMEVHMAIAKEYNLYVIEDNAQAIGANCKFWDQKKAGTIGHVEQLLFFLLKWMLWRWWSDFTNDDALAHKLRGNKSRNV
jgi:dTDP-4-amino-4,6-dideoxygalactose transaminase